MHSIIKVTTTEQIKQLAELASKIWHEYFTSLLTAKQIDYMVDKFQSEHAMKDQMQNQNYEYYFLDVDGQIVGYTGIKPEDDKLFLSKLYIQKEYRKHGYSHLMFDFIIDLCKNRKLKSIYLTVNKYNDGSIAVYNKKGFKNIRSQVTDIGSGFVMDDYVFELEVK